MVKVTALVGMIVIGLGVLTFGFSAPATPPPSPTCGPDGFFPKGVGAPLMTLQGVMFAYLAVELVGVTAGESEDPEKTLPKAINTVPWRIAALLRRRAHRHPLRRQVDRVRAGVSPFVAAFAKIGIPAGRRDRQLRRADRGPVLLQLRHVLHGPHALHARRLPAGAGRPAPRSVGRRSQRWAWWSRSR